MKPTVHPRVVWYGTVSLVTLGLVAYGTPLGCWIVFGLYVAMKTVLLERMGLLTGSA